MLSLRGYSLSLAHLRLQNGLNIEVGRGGRSFEGLKVLSPASEVGNLRGVFDSELFGEEAFDLGAVFESESADAERRRDAFDEAADGVFGESPDFDFDARAFEARNVDEAGFGGDGALEGVELVVGMGAAGADEAAVSLG